MPNGSQSGCHTDESQSKLITPHQVSYREQIHKLVNNQPRFVRAQLKFHVKQWQDITSDPFVLNRVSNCAIEFDFEPMPARHMSNPEYKFSSAEQQARLFTETRLFHDVHRPA